MADETEGLVRVCACGCNRLFEGVVEAVRFDSGYLNPDQAEALLKSKWVPRSEVKWGLIND